MSSGTFVLSVFLVCIFLLFNIFLSRSEFSKSFWLLIIFLLFMVLIFPLLEVLVSKNLDYYGGGITGLYNMLSHGLGGYFSLFDEVVVSLAVVDVILLYMLVRSEEHTSELQSH